MKDLTSEKPRVLIADDDECIQIIFSFLLEQEGWEVKQARDGQEALDSVLKWQPNLLLMDYEMPKLTGAEVYQKLQLYGIKITVILISSYIDLEQLAASLGIIYYLHKPFDIPDFFKIIKFACKNLICKG
ncbi:two-component response regulator [Anabaenopsis circularis NIES-21]|uniref:Two-component response regulator n=1 Tax=Anabaenopsis circularis NIES-21 TaxID=1085406 RepID=A0A1Z4GCG3_9CYAN|nr:two-component response regulator [Anabaenopsis circularis NIES-21]